MFLLFYIKNVETVKLSYEAIFESCGVRFHFARIVLHIKQMALIKRYRVFIKLIIYVLFIIFME